jgi:hypothetical protein
MKKLLNSSIVAALLLLPANLFAQIVTGVVLEEQTKMPIGGAIVELIGVDRARDAVAVTDTSGAFVLRPRRSGSFVINVTHLSYVSRDSMAIKIKPGMAVQVELRMGRNAIPLEPLIVKTTMTARLAGFHERALSTGSAGKFVTRADIERRPGTRRATDLLEELEGVEIVGVAPGGGSNLAPTPAPGTSNETASRTRMIRMGSSTASCEPAIFIDGVPVKQYTDSGIDEFLTPEMIEGVEVYPRSAGAPSEFVTSNHCGVVAFWTRAPTEESGRVTWKRVRMVGGFLVMMAGLVVLTN